MKVARFARLALAAGVLCLATTAQAVLGRDDQWSYVAPTIEHGPRAELRGDYPQGVPTRVIFQIECAQADRTIIFRFFPDLREYFAPYPEDEPFELSVNQDEQSFVMPRRAGDGPFDRRLGLTEDIVRAVHGAEEFWIHAPNEAGHPWHAGRAPALRQVVRECWEG